MKKDYTRKDFPPNRVASIPLGDKHVSTAVLKDLTDILRPTVLQRGDGEFGIGQEQQKKIARDYLSQKLGNYPWYRGE